MLAKGELNMKKIFALIMTVISLLTVMLSFTACGRDEETFTYIGTVVCCEEWSDGFVVYVTVPEGNSDNAPWFPFFVSKETKMASGYSKDLTKMPELAEGNIVKITYYTTPTKDPISHNYRIPDKNYRVTEIESVTPTKNDILYQALPLKLNENYCPETKEARENTKACWDEHRVTVAHIAKITCPISGYLIYVENSDIDPFSKYVCYWLDENCASVDETLLEKIKAGETGIEISPCIMVGDEYHPFKNLDVYYIWVLSTPPFDF